MSESKPEVLPGMVGDLTRRIERLEQHLGLAPLVLEAPGVTPAQPQKGSLTARRVADRVVDLLNRKGGRKLRADTYVDRVERVLKAGFTENEMRVVVWWAAQEWGKDPAWSKRITPSTLFKLQSPQGHRCFPEYLAEAVELYERRMGRPFDRAKRWE